MRPQYFYKFRSFDEHTDAIFVNRTAWFSKVQQFNDPFEFSATYSFDQDSEVQAKLYLKKLINEQEQLEEEEVEERVELMLQKLRDPNNNSLKQRLEKANQDRLIEFKNSISVYSLSAVCDDILLWAHYADGHKGFCLQFDATNEFFLKTEEITYSKDYPGLLYFSRDPEKDLRATVLTKSIHWRYEEEWRVFGEHGAHTFPENCLKGVILGCAITSLNKARIVNLIESFDRDILLFQVSRKEKEYGIDIIPSSRV